MKKLNLNILIVLNDIEEENLTEGYRKQVEKAIVIAVGALEKEFRKIVGKNLMLEWDLSDRSEDVE